MGRRATWSSEPPLPDMEPGADVERWRRRGRRTASVSWAGEVELGWAELRGKREGSSWAAVGCRLCERVMERKSWAGLL